LPTRVDHAQLLDLLCPWFDALAALPRSGDPGTGFGSPLLTDSWVRRPLEDTEEGDMKGFHTVLSLSL